MKRFTLNSLTDWSMVKKDEALTIPAGRKGRKVSIEVNTTGPVHVFAVYLSEVFLLGVADGHAAFDFTVVDDVEVQFSMADNTDCFMKKLRGTHIVEKTTEESHTRIARREQRNPEFDRMMGMMRHNEMLREQKLNAEIAKIRSQNNVVEKSDEPKPTETPAARVQKDDGKGTNEPTPKSDTDEATKGDE